MEKGDYSAPFAFYGYEKNLEDRHKLVVDEETAAEVREIFRLKIEGKTTGEIARYLN